MPAVFSGLPDVVAALQLIENCRAQFQEKIEQASREKMVDVEGMHGVEIYGSGGQNRFFLSRRNSLWRLTMSLMHTTLRRGYHYEYGADHKLIIHEDRFGFLEQSVKRALALEVELV